MDIDGDFYFENMWIVIFLLFLVGFSLMAAGTINKSRVAKQMSEIRQSTMFVVEQGLVEGASIPTDNGSNYYVPNVFYSLVEIQGARFLFLTSASSDGGVSAIQLQVK